MRQIGSTGLCRIAASGPIPRESSRNRAGGRTGTFGELYEWYGWYSTVLLSNCAGKFNDWKK